MIGGVGEVFNYDCPFGQVMSLDMLRIVMIWQSQSYNKNGNHTITFAQQIHNGEQSEPYNSKLFKFSSPHEKHLKF